MQGGRYGNVKAYARSQFISPGLLRQHQAKRTYPNFSSCMPINNDTNARNDSAKKLAGKSVGHVNYSQVANDESEDEREKLVWEKWGVNVSGTHASEDASEDFEDASDGAENENTTDSMLLQENNLSFKRDRFTDKDRHSKKLKSMDQDAYAISRDDGQDRTHDVRASVPQIHADSMSNAVGTKEKRVRGKNKCKKVAKLKPGEKIKVMFYNNRALCTSFARHIGRIVRDPTITPVRVKKWTDITETAQKHIFVVVKDKFENIDGNIELDVYKNEIMEHARDLWNNWRGDLSQHYVKPARNMQQAITIKNCPKDFLEANWEWLVKEHFFSKDFIARSKRNTENRSNLKILHHSGSKPFRKFIYDNGGKESMPPSLDALFLITHTKGGTFVDSESSSKHAQLEEQMSLDPSLSNVELSDKCFPSKRRDHVIGYGGGIKAKDLRSPAITKAELMEKLKESEDEKRAMREENRVLREENQATSNRVAVWKRNGIN